MPISDPSAAFLPGAVIKVPFPYTDRPTRQRRPALIVSNPDLQRRHGLSWVLMITSAANRGWEGDVDIAAITLAGLPAPSVVRTAKIATLNPDERTLAQFCERHHIRRLSLFGSQLKGTAQADSDIDLLVEFDPDNTPRLQDGASGQPDTRAVPDRARLITGV